MRGSVWGEQSRVSIYSSFLAINGRAGQAWRGHGLAVLGQSLEAGELSRQSLSLLCSFPFSLGKFPFLLSCSNSGLWRKEQ